jgi:hypothetical protein
MYRCKLVNKKGYIEKSFLRSGKSKQDVLESLDMYEWPEGDWVIIDLSCNDDA